MLNCLTIDVEDWFHILDCPVVPSFEQWGGLEGRVEEPMERILDMLAARNVKATFFWLGWIAQRNEGLLRRCVEGGHEVASHGYAHLLAYEAGREAFGDDIIKGKKVIEDIAGVEVKGFRAAGFSTTNDTNWTFDEICKAGYVYDSSVFPASRGHGGAAGSRMQPHIMETPSGRLAEFPQSVIEVAGKRISLFGGGYLRLAPKPIIRWGVAKLHAQGRPLVVYIHPREVDPQHPKLPLPTVRKFKCYVNLKSTMPKLEMLCRMGGFQTMGQMADEMLSER